METITKLAIGSILVAAAVLALKAVAWWLTGSVALLSDALESVVNVATAIAALLAIRLGDRPPDRNHPYGHHKAEYFSAVFEGILIVLAAIYIVREAYPVIWSPRSFEIPVLGLVSNAAASVANAFWATLLIRSARRERSPALMADGRHLMADVVSSVGVLAGVILASYTGIWLLDPLLAVAVAAYILWSGWRMLRASVQGLMDAAVPHEEAEHIRRLISDHAEGAIEAHDLRTRRAGRATFVEFHLVVPSDMKVSQSHDICDRLEKALRDHIRHVVITIHVEPEEKAKHSGIVVLERG